MNPHVDGRERGAALARLSARQVWGLLRELYRAWRVTRPPSPGAEATPTSPRWGEDELRAVMADGEHPFHAWRHETVGRLSEARQQNYLEILEFALRLQGRDSEADATRLRASCEPRARALHHFHQAVREANEAAWAAGVQFDAMTYAMGFLRNKRGCGLDDADERAIRHAAYVLQRKAGLLMGGSGRAAPAVPVGAERAEEVPF